ncbi:MAG: V-type ATPase subunit subunit G family protein [Candidatus Ratteibacteria bacterium]
MICYLSKKPTGHHPMKEILEQIIEKEKEARQQLELAQKQTQQILADARKKADEIIQQARITASKMSSEMIKKARQEIEDTRNQIIDKEKNKHQQIKKNWQPLVESTALKVFQKIIDIGHLTGKLFE